MLRTRTFAYVVIALLSTAAGGIAQNLQGGVYHTRDSLQRVVDSLEVLRAVAQARRNEERRLDSIRLALPAIADPAKRVVRVGTLTVVCDSGVVALAERTLRNVWPAIETTYGSQAAQLANERWLLVEHGTVAKDGSMRIEAASIGRDTHNGYRTSVDRRAFGYNRGRIEAVWMQLAGEWMFSHLGEPAAWLMRPLGTAEARRASLEFTFRELALSHEPLERRCYRGEVGACKEALGLTHPTGASALSTVDASGRIALLRIALHQGGGGAYARFATGERRSIARRLEDASRMPVDSLVSIWYSEVLAARPVPASTPLRTALGALMWGGLLCMLSLRSSRWR